MRDSKAGSMHSTRLVVRKMVPSKYSRDCRKTVRMSLQVTFTPRIKRGGGNYRLPYLTPIDFSADLWSIVFPKRYRPHQAESPPSIQQQSRTLPTVAVERSAGLLLTRRPRSSREELSFLRSLLPLFRKHGALNPRWQCSDMDIPDSTVNVLPTPGEPSSSKAIPRPDCELEMQPYTENNKYWGWWTTFALDDIVKLTSLLLLSSGERQQQIFEITW